MIKFQWPIKVKHREERKAVLGTSPELGSFLKFGYSGNAETPSSAMRLYERSTAVSIPINMVAEAFASIEPVLSTGSKTITKHPILDLIGQPSPFFTQDLFLETLGKNYLISGESYAVALGGITRPPLEIQPVSPSYASPIPGVNGLPSSIMISGDLLPGDYKLVIQKKTARFLDGNLRELIQIRNFSTKHNSMLRGQSPLLAASAEARQHIKGNVHNISLLDNGGRVSLVFHFEGDLNDDEFKELKKRVQEQYGGVNHAGEIGVTAGPKMDIKEMGITNKDMDFVKLQSAAKIAVAQQYKVPLPLILVDASTFNNYTIAMIALFDNAVLPLADRVFAGLTNLLMPRFGLDPAKIWVTYDPHKIPAIMERRIKELKLRRELNIESTNELREMIGREEVHDGDDILVQSSFVPLGANKIFDEDPDKPDVLRDDEEDDQE